MKKIPVGKTVAFAYNLLFTRFGTIVGITIVPAVLASVVDYLARGYLSPEETDAAARTNLLIWLASVVTTIFISSVAAVGVTRVAFNLPLGKDAYYFPVGPLELRMFAAKLRFWVGVFALLVLALVVSSFAFMAAGVPLDGAGTLEPSGAMLIAALVAWVAFGFAVFTIFRMGFLLSATVVVEEKGGLQRGHDLTRGNFWRIVTVLAALTAPILVLALVITMVLLRASLGEDYMQVLETADTSELMRRAEEAVEQNILIWEAFNAAMFILASSLIYGASAYAYHALTAKTPWGSDPMRPPADTGRP